MVSNIEEILKHAKKNIGRKKSGYNENIHCKMLLGIMLDPKKGRVSSFCMEAMVSEKTFYTWVNENALFCEIYDLGKNIARELWEQEGYQIREREYPLGVVNYEFEHWKMVGWSRFGVSNKNSRIKLNVRSEDSPTQQYSQILKQASEGDFTASEIKQLMEAVNVGLNTHNALELQKQLDQLKSDFETMMANTNVKNPFSDKGTKEKN